MPSRGKHIGRTRQSFNNKPWTEVHDFLDQFWSTVPSLAHRIILHHAMGVELVVARFGPDSRGPALLHIEDDCGEVPADPQEAWELLRHFVQPGQLGEVNAILACFGLPECGPGL